MSSNAKTQRPCYLKEYGVLKPSVFTYKETAPLRLSIKNCSFLTILFNNKRALTLIKETK